MAVFGWVFRRRTLGMEVGSMTRMVVTMTTHRWTWMVATKHILWWTGLEVDDEGTSFSQSTSHSSASSSAEIHTGIDVIAGSHTLSARTSGFSSRKNMVAGSGSITVIGSDSIFIVGISWVSWSAVGSGSITTVGAGSGSGMVIDVEWSWLWNPLPHHPWLKRNHLSKGLNSSTRSPSSRNFPRALSVKSHLTMRSRTPPFVRWHCRWRGRWFRLTPSCTLLALFFLEK